MFLVRRIIGVRVLYIYGIHIGSCGTWKVYTHSRYTKGEPSALDEVDQTIVECFKAKILPHVGPGDAGEGTVLRRVLVLNETGFFLQPDQKHFQKLAELVEVRGVKPAPIPISKGTGRTSSDALEPLVKAEATLYRRCVGICMYPGPDRYDVQFTVKGLASEMQAPTRLSMARLRRLVRGLCGTLHIGMFHMNQEALTVWTDWDRSGDVQTCTSTSRVRSRSERTRSRRGVSARRLCRSPRPRANSTPSAAVQSRGLTVKHVLLEVLDNIRIGAKIR